MMSVPAKKAAHEGLFGPVVGVGADASLFEQVLGAERS